MVQVGKVFNLFCEYLYIIERLIYREIQNNLAKMKIQSKHTKRLKITYERKLHPSRRDSGFHYMYYITTWSGAHSSAYHLPLEHHPAAVTILPTKSSSDKKCVS